MTTNIYFHKIHPDAKLPTRATKGSAGWDLYARDDRHIFAGGEAILGIGFTVSLPVGWEMQIRPRSGLARKSVWVANSPGTIDSDYEGEVGVILRLMDFRDDNNTPFLVKKGDRIAQAVFKEVPPVKVMESLTPFEARTERGSGGFGSSGR